MASSDGADGATETSVEALRDAGCAGDPNDDELDECVPVPAPPFAGTEMLAALALGRTPANVYCEPPRAACPKPPAPAAGKSSASLSSSNSDLTRAPPPAALVDAVAPFSAQTTV